LASKNWAWIRFQVRSVIAELVARSARISGRA
jgi:hypothetical protein